MNLSRDGAGPKAVEAVTEDYFSEQNVFAHWLDQHCRVEPTNSHLFSTSRELFESWKTFAEANGEIAGSSKGARLGGIAVVTADTTEFAEF